MAREGFDSAAAVTRSLLGWGVVAGPFYIVFGLVLALTRDGFALSRNPLSALLLGDHGWLQAVNLVLTGIMVGAAALGFARALHGRRGTATGALLGVYALCLVISAVFPPDPANGFPPGVPAEPTTSGVLHLAFGGIGFLSLAAAALVVAGGLPGAWLSRAAGAVVIVGFLGGAALSSGSVGIALLWAAVVVGWAWPAFASVQAYRVVPHPDLHRRATA
ncbi:DUF998 domain-containing protein [Pseudonocardia pini]|uniref:DUF998 domain-containing protein n=1 Tax=Pseudonocardia pini TaxID=2758030 RepID=UPI0015F09157|nr:DUF998 domain-containing protein [Pseudonocardia pini]